MPMTHNLPWDDKPYIKASIKGDLYRSQIRLIKENWATRRNFLLQTYRRWGIGTNFLSSRRLLPHMACLQRNKAAEAHHATTKPIPLGAVDYTLMLTASTA